MDDERGETRVEARLRHLERQVARQRKVGALLLATGLAGIAGMALVAAGPAATPEAAGGAGGAALAGAQDAAAPEDQVLRARGLVIVDEAGRERILIGAPIPEAENRVRTDMARVEEVWGPRFPRAYVDEYYPTYRHRMHGMLVLDENGFDRIAVGDSVPDPNIGQRIGPASGLLVNDPQGFERSGYGLLDVDGVYRVVLGLDGDDGREGVVLSLHDGGPRGLTISGDASIFLGTAPESTYVARGEAFSGLLMETEAGEAHRLEVE